MNADIKTQRLHFFLRIVANPFSHGALFFESKYLLQDS